MSTASLTSIRRRDVRCARQKTQLKTLSHRLLSFVGPTVIILTLGFGNRGLVCASPPKTTKNRGANAVSLNSSALFLFFLTLGTYHLLDKQPSTNTGLLFDIYVEWEQNRAGDKGVPAPRPEQWAKEEEDNGILYFEHCRTCL